jgi:hypothetical protein
MFDTIKGIIGDIASGAVKEQRILLSQEQLAVLDRKLRDTLEEVSALRLRVRELDQLVADRDARIAELEPKGDRLDDQTFQILKFFFDQARDLSAQDIASQFGLSRGVAEFHKDSLAEKGFLHITVIGFESDFGAQPAMFAITSEGRKYVMQHPVT